MGSQAVIRRNQLAMYNMQQPGASVQGNYSKQLQVKSQNVTNPKGLKST